MVPIKFKRGFNKIKINDYEFNESKTIRMNISCEENIDIKLIALSKEMVMSSDTIITDNYWNNEIQKYYSVNIISCDCSIYICFHAKCNSEFTVNDICINYNDSDISPFDFYSFQNKSVFPTWEELVCKEIDTTNDNGFDFPLIESTYDKEEIIAMMKLLTTNRLTMGKNVFEFEKQFAKYVGSKYAIMVNSGSSANLLSMAVATNYLRKNRLFSGDKILVPNICWSTSVWPIIQMNLKPVFVDVDDKTMNINIEDLRRKITPDVKGIVAVHILGNCTNMSQLMKIVNDNNLFLLEDTCESLGSKYKNKTLGTFGDFGTYSFYYSHHITTVEGGMVVCDKEEDYELLKCLRAHGWTRSLKNKQELENEYKDVDPRFLFVNVGYNLRPMEIQATMGLIQLNKLDSKNANRILNHKNITERVLNDPRNKNIFSTPLPTEHCSPAWFSLAFILGDELESHYNRFLAYLSSNGVENRPIVTGNFSRQPVFNFLQLDINPKEFKGAEILHKRGFFIGLSCDTIDKQRIDNLVDIFFNYDFTLQ